MPSTRADRPTGSARVLPRGPCGRPADAADGHPSMRDGRDGCTGTEEFQGPSCMRVWSEWAGAGGSVPRGPARSYPGARGRTPERAVVPGDARSYPGTRGRTPERAVVPRSARSYLRGALRYDRAELRTTGSVRSTTALDCVRPRGVAYDGAGPMAHGDEAQCVDRHPPRARRRARPRQQDDAGPRSAPAPEPPTSAPRPDEKSPEQPAHTPPSQHEEPVSGPQS